MQSEKEQTEQMQREKGRKREREQQSEAGTDDQEAGGAASSASATEALAALEAVKARSWDTLKSFNMSPGEMLAGLMQWSDVEQAADFFAKCPWPLSGTGRSVTRGRYGVHPPQWDGSSTVLASRGRVSWLTFWTPSSTASRRSTAPG